MAAILFSGKPAYARQAFQHLSNHKKLYWDVGAKISCENLAFPIDGYLHVKGDQVRYRVTIEAIEDFLPKHYEDPLMALEIKPEAWIREWAGNIDGIRSHPWKHALVISKIEPFLCPTSDFRKAKDGSTVKCVQRPVWVQPRGAAASKSSASA